ncbi:hypothetical protein KFU94_59775 [Chloroflexi bacterium TSY]|nr:hypothetical protein [Chloroflexi bacterium TSY]
MQEKDPPGPVVVLPIHDRDGTIFSHLTAITPQLKQLFTEAFVNISPATEQAHVAAVAALSEDEFFHLSFNHPTSKPGDHWLSACANAVRNCMPEQIVHLAGVDRIAFALGTEHQEQFIEDIEMVRAEDTPLLFHRSNSAWATHPAIYREVEQMVVRVGEMVLGKTLDFA